MLNITETKSTPQIVFNEENGELLIKGKSIPEDPHVTFSELLEQVREYAKNPKDQTIADFDFEYLNTSSVKWIFQILETFEKMHVDKKSVIVRFWYSDENVLETGNYLKNNIAVPMVLIKK